MLPDLLIVVPFALVLAVLALAARRGRRRSVPSAFRPPVPAETRYAVTVLPDPGPEREPFAYDNGLVVGERDQ